MSIFIYSKDVQEQHSCYLMKHKLRSLLYILWQKIYLHIMASNLFEWLFVCLNYNRLLIYRKKNKIK